MIRLFANTGFEFPIEKVKFPDNTCFFKINTDAISNDFAHEFYINWNYESDEEFLHVAYIKEHLYQNYNVTKINLVMPYVPNARMDRTKNYYEVFTLKVFAKMINSLNFNTVYCLDPHSHVSEALFDRMVVLSPNEFIAKMVRKFVDEYNEKPIIYYSDYSAMKRYSDMESLKNFHYLYGSKVREWLTGEIKGLDILDENNNKIAEDYPYIGSKVILVDDIISYGGTMYYGIKNLVEKGMNPVYVYATHTEQSSFHDEEKGKLKKVMDEREMKLFTTNSVYQGKSENNITVFDILKIY